MSTGQRDSLNINQRLDSFLGKLKIHVHIFVILFCFFLFEGIYDYACRMVDFNLNFIIFVRHFIVRCANRYINYARVIF